VSRRGRPAGRHRAAWVGAASLTVALSLSACGSGPTSPTPPAITYVPAVGGTLTVGVDQEPTGCNPNTARADTAADRLLLEPVLPSSFFVSDSGTSQYDSAVIVQAELQSTTPETVVYTIDPRAVWSDGVAISAADFIYAWQQQRGVTAGLPAGSPDVASTAGYDDIKSVVGSNKGKTVTVVFSTPYADWQSLFNDLVPAHVMEKVGWSPACHTLDPAVDLSGGPYVLRSVSAKTIVLVRNPRWWGQPAKLDRVVIEEASGPAQLARWLRRGVVQVAAPSSFSQGFLQAVSNMPYVRSEVNISSTFLELELSTIAPVTANPAVRLGIAHALDRQDLVNQVAGFADIGITPSVSHIYAQTQGPYPSNPSAPPVNLEQPTTTTTLPPATGVFPAGADLASSARELESAGYFRVGDGPWTDDTGKPLVLRLVVDGGDAWAAATARLATDQLTRAGVTVDLSSAPSASAAGSVLALGDADAALIPLTAGPYTTQTSAWYTPILGFTGEAGSQDWTNYDSTRVNQLFTEAMQELDPVTAQPFYAQADQLLWTEMVALPIFAEPTVLAWSDFTTGISPNPFGPGLLWQLQTWGLQTAEPVNYSGTPTLPG
jgi:peptide/nickel transport system substrate-binding protein